MYGTARQAYIDISTELLKEEAPTMYLEDFLYYYNKAISEYIKTRYELYETTQQLSDDLRFWKKEYTTQNLEVNTDDINRVDGENTVEHYRHLVGCVASIEISKPISRCDQRAGTTKKYKVTRMSSDIKAGLLNNAYLQPTFYRPYFEIISNKIKIDLGDYDPRSVKVNNIAIEYLCHPAYVDLNEEDISADINDLDPTAVDNTQVLEFTTDVGEEITKIALKLILERGSSNRLQSHVAVNQAISDVSSGMRSGK